MLLEGNLTIIKKYNGDSYIKRSEIHYFETLEEKENKIELYKKAGFKHYSIYNKEVLFERVI